MCLKSSVFLSGLLLWAFVAEAHDYECCEHEHPKGLGPENSTCEPEMGKPCLEGDNCNTDKTCEFFGNSVRQWCACKVQQECSAAGSNAFDPDVPGLPNEGDVLVYEASFEPTNGWSIVFGETVVAVFEAADEALQGTLTLQYGGFDDPINVPVTLVDMTLLLPSIEVAGMTSGPGLLRLRDGAPVDLVYDSVAGVLSPIDGSGIPLALDNDFGEGQEIVFWFEASLQDDGRMLMYGQGSGPGLDLEVIPTVSEWGLIVMTLLALTAGTIVFGRRRRPAVV